MRFGMPPLYTQAYHLDAAVRRPAAASRMPNEHPFGEVGRCHAAPLQSGSQTSLIPHLAKGGVTSFFAAERRVDHWPMRPSAINPYGMSEKSQTTRHSRASHAPA